MPTCGKPGHSFAFVGHSVDQNCPLLWEKDTRKTRQRKLSWWPEYDGNKAREWPSWYPKYDGGKSDEWRPSWSTELDVSLMNVFHR